MPALVDKIQFESFLGLVFRSWLIFAFEICVKAENAQLLDEPVLRTAKKETEANTTFCFPKIFRGQ